MHNLLIVGAISIGAIAGLGAQGPKPSAQVRVVAQLYADFACEAVLSEPGCDTRHQLVDQPARVLSRYFDEPLIRLWLADRACAKRTHEICKLDFAPMWDSQDPTGTFVRILTTPGVTAVNVELLSYRPSSVSRVIGYTLVETPAGWRIHNMSKGTEWSLVALLSGK